jgi:hypothetical protein
MLFVVVVVRRRQCAGETFHTTVRSCRQRFEVIVIHLTVFDEVIAESVSESFLPVSLRLSSLVPTAALCAIIVVGALDDVPRVVETEWSGFLVLARFKF